MDTGPQKILEQLLSLHCGVFKSVSRPDLPPEFLGLHLLHGELAASYEFLDESTPLLRKTLSIGATGCSFRLDEAMWRLVGEGLERYASANPTLNRTVVSAFCDLKDDAIDPREWIGYDCGAIPPKKPYRIFDPQAPIRWVKVKSITDEKPYWVPAIFCWMGYESAGENEHFQQWTSSGLAAGRTTESAIASALLELIERDCFMSRWQLMAAPSEIILDDFGKSQLSSQLRSLLASNFCELRFYDISLNDDLCVVLAKASLKNLTFGFTLGASAGVSEHQAIEKAASEALQVLIAAIGRRGKKPPKLSEVRKFIDHGFYYSSPRNGKEITSFFAGSTTRGVRPVKASQSSESRLTKGLEYLEKQDLQPFVIDLTTNDMEALGFRVVRCLVPGTQPITFGYRNETLDPRRLKKVAEQLSFRWNGKINAQLHPFA